MQNPVQTKYEMLALLGRVSIPMSIEQLAATLGILDVVATCDLIELQRRKLVVMVREDHAGQSYWAARHGQYGGEPWGPQQPITHALCGENAATGARAQLRRTAMAFAQSLRGAINSPQR